MKKILQLAAFVSLAIAAQAQNLTTVTGSNVQDLSGAKLATGQICFQATDASDNPTSFQAGGGGQVVRRPYCSAVTVGVITSFTVPNPALTVPAGINYRVTVKDTTLGSATNGQEILRYKNVSFVGAGFNFDAYGPSIGNVVPLTGTSTSGSLAVNGNLSVTGSANISISGNAATATALDHNPANCTSPQLAAGVDATGAAEGCATAAPPGQKIVDGVSFATIQSAITAASTTGSVLIPSSYAGSDVYTNPNSIQIIDLRGKPNRQRGYINMLVDCGLKGDGSTDDVTAAQACLNAYPGWLFWFPPTNTTGACSYFFSATLKPTGAGTTITGSSAGYANGNTTQGGTTLCWANGVTGIELDLTGQNCSGCNIRDLSMYGNASTNHLVTPTLLNMPSGANLPLYTRNISSIQRAANVLTVTVSRVNGSGEALTQQVGSTVKITGVAGDATMNGLCVISALSGLSSFGGNPTTFTCPQNGANSGPFASDGKTMLPTTGASTADGVLVCTNFATIIHVTIANFGRHGINADSSTADANCPTPFSDDLVLRDSTLIGNQADGYLCNGNDCNAQLLSGNAVYYNVLWGIHDESSLGNTHVGNQLSNGGHLWANSAVPSTKAISSISRTLTSGSSQASVVLSVADTNLKLGSCVFIAGVTDTSFNTTAGQCFFVNSFTDSTHFGYEQPGAPANASSSGGTSRMSTFAEAYLSSGVDDGAQKIQTQAGFSPILINQYAEGGQGCKWGNNTIMLGGANTPSCSGGGDWTGQFINTQVTGLGGQLSLSTPNFIQNKEFTGESNLRAGITLDKQYWLTWLNHSSLRAWILIGDPAGTLGGSGSIQIQSGNGQSRLILWGKDTNSGHTYLNAEGSGGKVIIGKNFAGTNAGTGGLEVDSGGASPAAVGGIDGAGVVTGATFKSTTANPASAGAVRLAKTDIINARNNANSGDIPLLQLNASDQAVCGNANGCTDINGNKFSTIIASGTSSLGTGAISATTCATVVTTAATNTATTDAIEWAFNAAPGTGYTSGVHVLAYPTSGNVNFLVCNPTAGSLTPAAATLNWKVIR